MTTLIRSYISRRAYPDKWEVSQGYLDDSGLFGVCRIGPSSQWYVIHQPTGFSLATVRTLQKAKGFIVEIESLTNWKTNSVKALERRTGLQKKVWDVREKWEEHRER